MGPFIETVDQFKLLVSSTATGGRPLVVNFTDGKGSFVDQVFEARAADYPQLYLKMCNGDACAEVAEEAKVSECPAILVFMGGSEVHRVDQIDSGEDLTDCLNMAKDMISTQDIEAN